MIPIIIGAVAIGAGALGVGAIGSGLNNFKTAKEIAENAKNDYEKAQELLKEDFEEVNRAAEIYGRLQIKVKLHTIKRFIELFERIGQVASQDLSYLEGLEISVQEIKELKTIVIDAENLIKMIPNAVAAGAGGAGVAYGAAQAFGVVRVARFFGLWAERVAVQKLAGAAAGRGMLVWLGYGNAALGGVALGGIALGPALMIGGYQLAADGQKALTEAHKYKANVAVAIKKIENSRELLVQVDKRIQELEKLVYKLEKLSNELLDILELILAFDYESHKPKIYQFKILINALPIIVKNPKLYWLVVLVLIQILVNFLDYLKINQLTGFIKTLLNNFKQQKLYKLTLLVKALSEILNTPILTKKGDAINMDIVIIYAKYRTLGDN